MNIYNYLKRDHQTVAELFDKILSSKSLDKRMALFQEVASELLLHSETENATFYAALKKNKEASELIKHAEKEHNDVKACITKIRGMSVESEKWLEQVGELKHSVTHHVEEEEGEIFKKAKKILSSEEAKKLAADMDRLKMESKAA